MEMVCLRGPVFVSATHMTFEGMALDRVELSMWVLPEHPRRPPLVFVDVPKYAVLARREFIREGSTQLDLDHSVGWDERTGTLLELLVLLSSLFSAKPPLFLEIEQLSGTAQHLSSSSARVRKELVPSNANNTRGTAEQRAPNFGHASTGTNSSLSRSKSSSHSRSHGRHSTSELSNRSTSNSKSISHRRNSMSGHGSPSILSNPGSSPNLPPSTSMDSSLTLTPSEEQTKRYVKPFERYPCSHKATLASFRAFPPPLYTPENFCYVIPYSTPFTLKGPYVCSLPTFLGPQSVS